MVDEPQKVLGVDTRSGLETNDHDLLQRIYEMLEATALDQSARLSQEMLDSHHQSSLDDQAQRRSLRKLVVWLALAVIFFMMVLIGLEIYLALFGGQDQVPGSVRIALFVSPIISISTITIFLLVGVFRGFREKDVENLPVKEITRETTRVLSGN